MNNRLSLEALLKRIVAAREAACWYGIGDDVAMAKVCSDLREAHQVVSERVATIQALDPAQVRVARMFGLDNSSVWGR